MRLPLSYSELTNEAPADADMRRILLSYRRRSAFFTLAKLNTLISFYPYASDKQRFVQSRMLERFTDAAMLRRITTMFPGERLWSERIVFHRQQFLTMMKIILLESETEGDRDLAEDAVAQRELGTACLMLNDLLFLPEQEQRLQPQEGSDEEKRIRSELFSQLVFSAELSNIPKVPHATARNHEYLKIFDREAEKFPFSGGAGLSQVFKDLRGIELKRYLWLISGTWSSYKYESEDPTALLQEPAKINIGKKTIFSKMDVAEEEIETFFELTTTDYDDLASSLKNNPPSNQTILQQDFTIFRTHPLIYTRDERDIATSNDFGFLSEKLALGLYHTVLKTLEGHEPERTNFLRRYWGDVFEIYVNGLLREAFPVSKRQFLASPMFDRAGTEHQAFDGVLIKGNKLVSMEYKGKYLTVGAKYSGDRNVLIHDLEEKFGHGVRQLAMNLAKVFDVDPEKREGFSERDGENRPIQFSTDRDAQKMSRVYPLIIVQDFSLSIGFANFHLREMFDKEIQKYPIIPGIIRPFSLITIEDLEIVIPYLSQVNLFEILDRYIERLEPIYSFQNVFFKFIKKRKLREPERDSNQSRIDAILEDMKSIYRNEEN
jgi:hypothetical protein